MEDNKIMMTEDKRTDVTDDAAGEQMIRDAFDRLGPSDELKADMWSRIEAASGSKGRRTDGDARGETAAGRWKKASATGKGMRTGFVRRVVAIAAALLLIVGGVTWYSGQSGTDEVPGIYGNVYAAESRETDMTADEILVSVGDPAAAGNVYVYAPKIYYLDDQRLIFGNATGLIIYDLVNDRVDGLIDMQAICSGYYNSDTIRTHVLVEGDELTVYNSKGQSENLAVDSEETAKDIDEPFGYYHRFDLSGLKGDGSLLTHTESGDDKDVIRDMMGRGAVVEDAVYADAWDNVAYLQSAEMDNLIGRDGNTYSELAYVRETDTDGWTENILVSRDGRYELVSENGSGKIASRQLDLGITDSVRKHVKELTELPGYMYAGDDAAVGAICKVLAADEEGWYGTANDGGVNIPVPVIYGKEQRGDELLVFGNFWTERYIRQGNTLVFTSGGEMPACYHLKENADGYEIVSVEAAEDGERYGESIREFTKDYPLITSKFFSEDNESEHNKARIEAIKAYTGANQLGVRYVKDYGWDPIALD